MGLNILLVGSTGLTGREILSKLLEDDRCQQVISLVRRPSNTKHPKLKEIIWDFKMPADLPSPGNLDACILCLGSTIKKAGSQQEFERIDRSLTTFTAKFAREHGATSCAVISAVGAHGESKIFYNQVKGKMEADLDSMGFKRLLVFRPGLLLGDRKERRFGERMAQILMGTWTQWFFGKYASLHVNELAESMVNTVLEPTAAGGVYHFPEMKKWIS